MSVKASESQGNGGSSVLEKLRSANKISEVPRNPKSSDKSTFTPSYPYGVLEEIGTYPDKEERIIGTVSSILITVVSIATVTGLLVFVEKPEIWLQIVVGFVAVIGILAGYVSVISFTILAEGKKFDSFKAIIEKDVSAELSTWVAENYKITDASFDIEHLFQVLIVGTGSVTISSKPSMKLHIIRVSSDSEEYKVSLKSFHPPAVTAKIAAPITPNANVKTKISPEESFSSSSHKISGGVGRLCGQVSAKITKARKLDLDNFERQVFAQLLVEAEEIASLVSELSNLGEADNHTGALNALRMLNSDLDALLDNKKKVIEERLNKYGRIS